MKTDNRKVEDDNANKREMGLGEHIHELRSRLLFCVFSFLPLFVLSFVFYNRLWAVAILPAKMAAKNLDKELGALINLRPDGPSDMLIALAYWNAVLVFILISPIWIYQLWLFIAPGMLPREKNTLKVVLGSGFFLFMFGMFIGYWWAVPLALEFLVPFNVSLEAVENLWSAEKYLNFLQMSCIGFGLAFETPLVMWALGKFGILRSKMLSKYWRHAVMAIVMIAALLTPPDPFTLFLMAGPLIVLLLIGWWLVKLSESRPEVRAELPSAEAGEDGVLGED